MATLETAGAKLARKASQMTASYNASKGRQTQNYSSGMQRFFGAPIAGHIVSAHQAGVAAAEYRPPDPEKWKRNFRAKMTGG